MNSTLGYSTLIALSILSATFSAAGVMAQSSAPSETTRTERAIAGGTAINAVLDTSIDAKKAKSGETVMAHTTEAMKSTDNRAILPKGTKLTGHVTQASSRSSGGSETVVAIQFDKAMLKDGQEVPLAGFTIQALAAPWNGASAQMNENDRLETPSNTPSNNPSMSGSRGARPETNPGVNSYPNGEHSGAPAAEPNAAGPLPTDARGVYGLDGVRLGTSGNASEGSVIESSGKNLRLDKGTRLLLVGQPQSGAASSR